jgi:uncharacterized membrane protein YhaH (DUF805 family)
MTFVDAVSTCLKKYSDFKGRATRSEYWWFALFFGVVLAVTSMVHEYAMPIALLGLLLPVIAVTTRRLHDTDHSGWFQLLNMIPLGNFYVLYLTIKQGTEGSNRF